jgi:hypothetical protein
MRQHGRGETDGAKKIGCDSGFSISQVGLLLEKLFAAHDACVVDEDIERGEFGDSLRGECAKRDGIAHVDNEGLHAGVGGDDFVEGLAPAAGNDNLVAESVKRFGESAAKTGAAASDENCIAAEIHGTICL